MHQPVKLLPSPSKYRFAIGLGGIIAACHSGEERDLISLQLLPLDAGSDAAVEGVPLEPTEGGVPGGAAGSAGFPPGGAGAGGAGGGGGTAGFAPGGGAAGDADGGTPLDDGGGDIPDASDADATAAETGAAISYPDSGLHCADQVWLYDDCAVREVGLGQNFNCARSYSGRVKCWGVDANGSLGRGTLGVDITHPSQILPIDFGTSRQVSQLSVGRHHACVLFEDGKARCWGDNSSGQLGIGSTNDYGDEASEPLSALPDLPLENIQSITAGVSSTCAVVDYLENWVYCWGSNLNGELGVGTTTQQEAPGQKVGLGAVYTKQTIVGSHWACSLLDYQHVRCWGDDDYGVRGVGPTSTWLGDDELPDSNGYNVLGLTTQWGFLHWISGSYSTACAIAGSDPSSGDVYCWGRNSDGRAGYPVATYGESIWQPPRKVNLGDLSFARVSASGAHTCALDEYSHVHCWGTDPNGALGYPGVSAVGVERDPVLDYALMQGNGDGGLPVIVLDDAGMPLDLPPGAIDLGDFDPTIPDRPHASSIDVGEGRSCATMDNGALRCWGDNRQGLVGYPEVEFIGVTDTPAEAYQQIGYSDVKVFGPYP